MTASPIDDLASAERRNQELTKALSQARGELVEAREQQAATSEILRVISSSPTDLQRVFAEIATSAARLCDAYDAVIRQVDGEVLRRVAHHGPIPVSDTLRLSRGVQNGRAVLDRRTIHVADLQAEGDEYPEGRDVALRVGVRTQLAVPLTRAGRAIGVISLRRAEVRLFTDRQIELLKVFADQAVIAIENTRLFEEVKDRTRELQGSLEYQTATSEILNVISKSPTDVQPVFQAIAHSAARLCDAKFCHVFRFDGEHLHFAAEHGLTVEGAEAIRRLPPLLPSRRSGVTRSILSGTVEEIPDVLADPEYQAGAIAKIIDYRSLVAVPMLNDARPVGAIAVARTQTGRFAQRHIELLKTFADQAVIAIENTRLFEEVQARTKELQDSLDRQTATSEVLGVISRSPNEVQPVLDTIVATARRLCQAERAIIWRLEGETFRAVAHHGLHEEWVESVYSARMPIKPRKHVRSCNACATGCPGRGCGHRSRAGQRACLQSGGQCPHSFSRAPAVKGPPDRRHHTGPDQGRAVR
jgi:GAF domain-containing protein